MRINDKNFIKELKKQNPESLDFIINSYGSLLKAVVSKVLWSFQDDTLIDECISDVLIAVWNNIDKFDDKKGNFKSWICTIAKYKAVDAYRRRKSKQEHEEISDDFSHNTSAEDQCIAIEDNKAILNLIDNMDEPDRTIFIMKFLLNEKTVTISKAVNLTVNTVNVRINRGREKLKKAYERKTGGGF